MFGQHSITPTQTSAHLDILRNDKLQTAPSEAKPFSLFPPSPASTGGRLFLSANDPLPSQNTSSLPAKEVDLEKPAPSSAAPATAPNVLIPAEGRITKASHDNALPIFFAGAHLPERQQEEEQLAEDHELDTSSGKLPSMQAPDLTTQKDDGPSTVSTNTESASKEETEEPSINHTMDDEIRTIRIFGFPPNLSDTLRTHFEKYGRIEASQHSPGNWLSILYASPTSATTAVAKSNRMVIADTFMIGVTLATTNLKPIPSKSLLARKPTDHHHQEQPHDHHVYKSIHPVTDGVFANRSSKKPSSPSTTTTTTAGTGKAGVSVAGGPTVATSNRASIPQTTGWIGFFKDILFDW
ncbi:hypothetical protein BCR42DRAFT_420957 [Absidia repens]|uniref:RRM Nup35-type domain-containing protein n=1 Tax=Absidia repens TaxID=90262 RepID=A0A1X2I968_9FUNG|nr:hypothetical protein BCR42DRAFT_420957 [Absidia repens]